MSDLADKLDIKSLPIPTAQRLDVFVCPGVPEEALRRWETQGGETTFHHHSLSGRDMSKTCGMVLFVTLANGLLDVQASEQLQRFYDRAGTETNAFQWQPIEKNFVRRDRDWFFDRKT